MVTMILSKIKFKRIANSGQAKRLCAQEFPNRAKVVEVCAKSLVLQNATVSSNLSRRRLIQVPILSMNSMLAK